MGGGGGLDRPRESEEVLGGGAGGDFVVATEGALLDAVATLAEFSGVSTELARFWMARNSSWGNWEAGVEGMREDWGAR